MKIRTKLLLLIVLTPFLPSCVTAPPNLSDAASARIAVPVTKIIIADYTRQNIYDPYKAPWSGGFHPLLNTATIPPFTELVLKSLNDRLYAAAGDGEANLEIAVLDARLFSERHVAETIPFVGIASVFSERKFMCSVDVSFRYGDKTVRKAFEAVDSKSRTWGDLPTNEKAAMVHNLLDQVVESIAHFSSELIGR